MKIVLSSSVLAAALFASGSASAQSAPYYVATPAAVPAQTSVVTRSTMWRARGPVMVAQRAPERPVVLCRLLADRAGRIASFVADGKPLDADKLAECNAKVPAETVAAK